MVTETWLQVTLSLAFAGTALSSVAAAAASRRITDVIGHVLHIGMSLDMIAMCWPWWMAVPAWPQGAFFAAATGWFLARIGVRVRRRDIDLSTLMHHGTHVIMMATMLWMVVAMHEMPADMPADAPMDHAAGHAHTAMAASTALTGSVLTALLIASCAVFCLDAARRRSADRLFPCANAVMCAGMTAMCWPMIGA